MALPFDPHTVVFCEILSIEKDLVLVAQITFRDGNVQIFHHDDLTDEVRRFVTQHAQPKSV
jgi:hypothetical protein